MSGTLYVAPEESLKNVFIGVFVPSGGNPSFWIDQGDVSVTVMKRNEFDTYSFTLDGNIGANHTSGTIVLRNAHTSVTYYRSNNSIVYYTRSHYGDSQRAVCTPLQDFDSVGAAYEFFKVHSLNQCEISVPNERPRLRYYGGCEDAFIATPFFDPVRQVASFIPNLNAGDFDMYTSWDSIRHFSGVLHIDLDIGVFYKGSVVKNAIVTPHPVHPLMFSVKWNDEPDATRDGKPQSASFVVQWHPHPRQRFAVGTVQFPREGILHFLAFGRQFIESVPSKGIFPASEPWQLQQHMIIESNLGDLYDEYRRSMDVTNVKELEAYPKSKDGHVTLIRVDTTKICSLTKDIIDLIKFTGMFPDFNSFKRFEKSSEDASGRPALDFYGLLTLNSTRAQLQSEDADYKDSYLSQYYDLDNECKNYADFRKTRFSYNKVEEIEE